MARLRSNVHITPGGALTLLAITVLTIFAGWAASQFIPDLLAVVVGLVVFLFGLLVAGVFYQKLADRRDRALYPPPGEQVDLGNLRLHVHQIGDPRDSPVVVFENSTGPGMPQWGWIAPEVACSTRVVMYDRLGQGWSPEDTHRMDAIDWARTLRKALEAAGANPPFVLVGYGLGGLLARVFAQAYLGDMAGLVLIDPRVNIPGAFPSGSPERQGRTTWLASIASRLGLLRLSGAAKNLVSCLPDQQAHEATAFYNATRAARGWRSENALAENAAQVVSSEPGCLGNLPLLVVSAEESDSLISPGLRPKYTAHHQALARLSTRGEHRVVPGANHFTIILDETYAEVVEEAIRTLVLNVRQEMLPPAMDLPPG